MALVGLGCSNEAGCLDLKVYIANEKDETHRHGIVHFNMNLACIAFYQNIFSRKPDFIALRQRQDAVDDDVVAQRLGAGSAHLCFYGGLELGVGVVNRAKSHGQNNHYSNDDEDEKASNNSLSIGIVKTSETREIHMPCFF
jgi:hypothetical protein